jgi:hypothetical protein
MIDVAFDLPDVTVGCEVRCAVVGWARDQSALLDATGSLSAITKLLLAPCTTFIGGGTAVPIGSAASSVKRAFASEGCSSSAQSIRTGVELLCKRWNDAREEEQV